MVDLLKVETTGNRKNPLGFHVMVSDGLLPLSLHFPLLQQVWFDTFLYLRLV